MLKFKDMKDFFADNAGNRLEVGNGYMLEVYHTGVVGNFRKDWHKGEVVQFLFQENALRVYPEKESKNFLHYTGFSLDADIDMLSGILAESLIEAIKDLRNARPKSRVGGRFFGWFSRKILSDLD